MIRKTQPEILGGSKRLPEEGPYEEEEEEWGEEEGLEEEEW